MATPCFFCNKPYSPNHAGHLPCKHMIGHGTCAKKYVREFIANNPGQNAQCPIDGCQQEISSEADIYVYMDPETVTKNIGNLFNACKENPNLKNPFCRIGMGRFEGAKEMLKDGYDVTMNAAKAALENLALKWNDPEAWEKFITVAKVAGIAALIFCCIGLGYLCWIYAADIGISIQPLISLIPGAFRAEFHRILGETLKWIHEYGGEIYIAIAAFFSCFRSKIGY